jgi:hypothetical protein
MEEGENISFDELRDLKEIEIEVDKDALEVSDGFCKECNEKLVKMVENRSILDGSVTFHIIKLKCMKCGREYLDLDQAEKYDFLLTLEKAVKQPLDKLTRKIVS